MADRKSIRKRGEGKESIQCRRCGAPFVAPIADYRVYCSKQCLWASMRGKPIRTSHGMSETPEYQTWQGMKSRCTPGRGKESWNYGDRGIRVCERWATFETFLADMGTRPSPQHSIDRIDVNGHYEPGNVRWATMREQSRNRRNNCFIEWQGKRQTVTDWCDELGLSAHLVYSRLSLGWTAEKAITKSARPKVRILTFGGVTMGVEQWAERLGLSSGTLRCRITRGWSIERALQPRLHPNGFRNQFSPPLPATRQPGIDDDLETPACTMSLG